HRYCASLRLGSDAHHHLERLFATGWIQPVHVDGREVIARGEAFDAVAAADDRSLAELTPETQQMPARRTALDELGRHDTRSTSVAKEYADHEPVEYHTSGPAVRSRRGSIASAYRPPRSRKDKLAHHPRERHPCELRF